MAKVKLNKEVLLDALDRPIVDEITQHNRWTVGHWMVFEHEGKYYGVGYREGATECQDESPFEYDGPEIECVEVHQVEKLMKVWEPV